MVRVKLVPDKIERPRLLTRGNHSGALRQKSRTHFGARPVSRDSIEVACGSLRIVFLRQERAWYPDTPGQKGTGSADTRRGFQQQYAKNVRSTRDRSSHTRGTGNDDHADIGVFI